MSTSPETLAKRYESWIKEQLTHRRPVNIYLYRKASPRSAAGRINKYLIAKFRYILDVNIIYVERTK